MATLNSGLGGTAGYGEQSFKTGTLGGGNLDDGFINVNISSVFGAAGMNINGTSYSSIYISTNGLITFNSGVTAYTPTTLSSLGQPSLAPFWTDIDIRRGGDIYWDLDPGTGKVTITWLNAAPFNGSGTNSFQVVLTATGAGDFSVDYLYENIGYTNGNNGQAVTGFYNGATQTLLEGSGNAAFLATYATNDFDTNDPAGVYGMNFEGGAAFTGDGIVDGTAGSDTIDTAYTGDPGGDRVDNNDATGFAGTTGNADYIRAGAGNDVVNSGLGNDIVFGGTGNDTVNAGYGNDTVDGGDGNDSIDGASGNDSLDGGAGDDVINGGSAGAGTTYTPTYTEVTTGTQTVSGTSGRPNFAVRTTSGDNDLTTGTNGTVSGFRIGNGDSTEAHTHAASSQVSGGQIIFNGMDANEFATIQIDGVTIDLNTAIANGTVTFNGNGFYGVNGSGQLFRSGGTGTNPTTNGTLVINVPYTTFSVLATGTNTNATTSGFYYEYYVNTQPLAIAAEAGGDDTLLGGLGNDTLFGGDGNDVESGGDGNDVLSGGTGNDSLSGGTGNDSLSGDAGNDTLSGDAGNDTLLGGDGTDSVSGGDGNDQMFGGLGNDTLAGDAGSDTLSGDAGNDRLFGGDGADSVMGGLGNDVLSGDAGDDTLDGGDGNDTIHGGAGSDTVQGDAGADLIYGDPDSSGAWGVRVYSYDFQNLNDQAGLGEANGTLQLATSGTNFDSTAYVNAARGTPGQTVDYSDFEVVYESTFTAGTAGAYRFTTTSDDGSTIIIRDAQGNVLNWTNDVGGTLPYMNNDFHQGVTTRGGSVTLVAGQSYTIEVHHWENAGSEVISATVTPPGGSSQNLLGSPFIGAPESSGFAGGDSLAGGAGNDTIFGNAGNDTLFGGTENDLLYGGVGNDTLSGDAGNDTLSGDDGEDTLSGGDGNDSLAGGAGNDSLSGDAGNDSLFGGAGNDQLFGGTGDDSLYGEDGNDSLSGGDGQDSLLGGLGNDSLIGDAGNDSLYGDAGNDTLTGGDGNDVLFGGVGNDSLLGDVGNDTLSGDDGEDTLSGGDGNDSLAGGAGNDSLSGDAGNDSLFGGAGNDQLFGGTGDDSLYGEDGNDSLSGGDGQDSLLGGLGNDSLIGDAGNDSLYGDAGNDTLSGGADNDVLFGGVGNDSLLGDAGNDTLSGDDGEDTLSGGDGNDSLAGGAGNDSLSGDAGNDSLFGGAGNDQLFGGTGDDSLYGEDGNDSLSGGDGQDSLLGGLGNDSLIGDAGNDSLYGDAGNDTLSGGADNDVLFGGVGNDSLLGDAGNDTLSGDDGEDTLSGGDGNDSLAGGAGNDSLSGDAGNDSLFGGAGNDQLFGGTGDDSLYGEDGNDSLSGGDGQDSLLGGLGNDSLIGDAGNDSLYGDAGNDTLSGGADNDVLFGGVGNDLLSGGVGDDSLYGGDGSDTLAGDAGSDQLFGGLGDDSLAAGDGNDTLTGGAGADTLRGDAGFDTADYSASGAGVTVNLATGTGLGGDAQGDVLSSVEAVIGSAYNDVLTGGTADNALYGGAGNDILTGGDGADSIYGGIDNDSIMGGSAGDVVDGGENTGDNDILDLSNWGWRLTNVIYDENNPENGTVEFLDQNGDVIGTMTFQNIEKVIPCFTPGTRIVTDHGEVAVEDLRAGDMILTRDNGFQPLIWAGQRHLSASDLVVQPRLCPVRIGAGALGHGLPVRDMMVSPQHRMLVDGPRAEMLFGESEVLVAATHLTGLPGIEGLGPQGITYVHIMFDGHEIVCADGAWSESFQPAQRMMDGMGREQIEELLALFPELAVNEVAFPSARQTLKAHEAKVLLGA